jgi:hypothetical protein
MLADLLKRWLNLEQGWQITPDGEEHLFIAISGHHVARILATDPDFCILATDPNILNRTIIQAGLQHAIDSRPGWDWVLQSCLNPKGETAYLATVHHPGGKEFWSEEFDEPAIALLSAYIQALEEWLGGGCNG